MKTSGRPGRPMVRQWSSSGRAAVTNWVLAGQPTVGRQCLAIIVAQRPEVIVALGIVAKVLTLIRVFLPPLPSSTGNESVHHI